MTTNTTKELGQYYTKPSTVGFCLDKLENTINLSQFKIGIEPSAGTGEFSNVMTTMFEQTLFFDIKPKAPNIIKQDFLKLDLKFPGQKVIVIGNPPFGKNSSLALKFLNKCLDMADAVAFILPNTFNKASITDKININSFCVYNTPLPKNSFYTEENKDYDVPCSFQIWINTPVSRNVKSLKATKLDIKNNTWLDFVKYSDDCDLIIRRAGSKTGDIITNYKKNGAKDKDGFYFCKIKNPKVLEVLNTIEYKSYLKSVINNTAGQRSLSKTELINILNLFK